MKPRDFARRASAEIARQRFLAGHRPPRPRPPGAPDPAEATPPYGVALPGRSESPTLRDGTLRQDLPTERGAPTERDLS